MNFGELQDAAELIDASKLKKVKLAILGNHATQFLRMALQSMGLISEMRFDIYEAEYDQIEMEIIDTGSGLYEFQPSYVFIVQSSLSLQKIFYQMKEADKANFAEIMLAKNSDLVSQLAVNSPGTKVLLPPAYGAKL